MSDSQDNAVTRRLALITERYEEFTADEDARLLRFLADQGDAKLFEVWLDVEDTEAGQQPDLFMRLDIPFMEAARHGFQLIEAIRKSYAEFAEGLKDEGLPADWKCPPHDLTAESDSKALLRVCASLQKHHADLMETLVLLLFPSSTRPSARDGRKRSSAAPSPPKRRAAPRMGDAAMPVGRLSQPPIWPDVVTYRLSCHCWPRPDFPYWPPAAGHARPASP